MTKAFKQKISRYIDAGFPILYINTFEEFKAEEAIKNSSNYVNVLMWGDACGYGEYNTKNEEWDIPMSKENCTDLNSALENKLAFPQELERSVIIIKDAHIELENIKTVTLLKELAIKISMGIDSNIILISSIVKIPPELEKYITIIESEHQTFGDICIIIDDFIESNYLPKINSKLREELAITFKGLSEFEIQNLLALAVSENGEITRSDLALIFEQKKQVILKSGVLEMVSVKESVKDIGGLENLKKWLNRKAKVVKNIRKAEEFGVDMPKGVLIAGVPGCGKSLCAKAASTLFEVPLLRLDIGKLMGKYLGESETNMRKAITLAEAISPCILWVDELEKAFAGIGSDGGHEVTSRLFGTFLTWMQEKSDAVFVVATANNISKLPPELLRKGRFDEIFYVDLPNENERTKIFEIHIAKRRKSDLSTININELVKKSKGYSGADIEGVIREAIENTFADEKDALTTEYILDVINGTNSLSEIMKDSLNKLRDEYKNRKFKNASMQGELK